MGTFLCALQTVAVFLSAVTAGLLLTTSSGHTLHSAASYTVYVVAVVQVGAAVLAWMPGGGSPRPFLFAEVFLALVLAQVALGIAHNKDKHKPLGGLLFGV